MEPNPKKVSLESYMSSDLSSCSCHSSSHGGCQGVGTTTIVSHLLLPRLHESEWGASLVSMQHLTSLFPMIPIVIFADRKWADMAANAHPLGPKANSLCVIRMDIAELPETWYAKEYAAALVSMWRKNPNKQSMQDEDPEKFIIDNSKATFAARAALHNVFGTQKFIWLDSNLNWPMHRHYFAHDTTVDALTCKRRVCTGFGGIVTQAKKSHAGHNDSFISLLKDGGNCKVASAFSGSKDALLRFALPYFDAVRGYLSRGVVDNEDGIMLHLWKTRKNLLEDTHCSCYNGCAAYLVGAHRWHHSTDLVYK